MIAFILRCYLELFPNANRPNVLDAILSLARLQNGRFLLMSTIYIRRGKSTTPLGNQVKYPVICTLAGHLRVTKPWNNVLVDDP